MMLRVASRPRPSVRSDAVNVNVSAQAPTRSFAVSAKFIASVSHNYSHVQASIIRHYGIAHSNTKDAREIFDKITSEPQNRTSHVADAIFDVYLQNLDKEKANEILHLLGRYATRRPHHYLSYFYYFYDQIDAKETQDLERRIFADNVFWKVSGVDDDIINGLYRYLYLQKQSLDTLSATIEQRGELFMQPMHQFVSHLESKHKNDIPKGVVKLSGLKDDKPLVEQLKAMTPEQREAIVNSAKESNPDLADAYLAFKGKLTGNDFFPSETNAEAGESDEPKANKPFTLKTSYKDLKSPLDFVSY